MTFGDTPIIALGFAALLWASQTHADGIAETMMPADPCGVYAPEIEEADGVAQETLFALNCGRIPTVVQIALAYVPNDPDHYWAFGRKPLPPQPVAPVPLPAGGGLLLAALFAMIFAGYRRGWCDATDTAPADERVM